MLNDKDYTQYKPTLWQANVIRTTLLKFVAFRRAPGDFVFDNYVFADDKNQPYSALDVLSMQEQYPQCTDCHWVRFVHHLK